MANDQREMTLEEVAKQYGDSHSAARSYNKVSRLIKQIKQCDWWQFTKKHKLVDELYKEIQWIESVK